MPVAPGKSRLFFGFISNAALPPPLRWLAAALDFVFHLTLQQVLDSDAFLLHVQVRGRTGFARDTQ